MNLPDILNVALGLVLLFFLLSTVASLCVELITTFARYREEILQVTVQRLLLGGPDQPWHLATLMYDRAVVWMVPDVKMLREVRGKLRPSDDFSQYTRDKREERLLRAFWEHPKIRSLVPNDSRAPAALEAETFARVLVDIAVPKNTQGELPDNRLALDRALAIPAADLPDGLRGTLRGLTLATEIPPGATGTQLWTPFCANIASWYTEASRQASEIYRAKMKRLLFFVGFGLALALNADAVRVVKVLSQDGSLRDATAAYAATVVAESQVQGQPEAAADLQATRKALGKHVGDLRKLESIGFPLGWTAAEWNEMLGRTPAEDLAASGGRSVWDERLAIALVFLLKILGVAATGLAVAQGGPFWYELMQKLINLRKGGESSPAKPDGKAELQQKPAEGKLVPATPMPLEIGYDLTTPATGFSARKAYWLARASAAAYAPEAEVESLLMKNWHFHECEFLDEQGSQCFVAADDALILVAFRGTELTDVRDALADAKVALKALVDGETRRVHAGFLEYFQRLERRLMMKLTNLQQARPGRQVYLTGHSLGGAMATVMFAMLVIQRELDMKKQRAAAASEGQPSLPSPLLYTFGCPRVGDAEFARHLDRLYPGRIFRVENHVDVVPQLPPPAGYHHVGRRMRFNEKGEMEAGPSGLSLLLAEVEGAITKDNLKEVAEEKFAAHGIAKYVGLCENLAKTVA
jgi:triacylglycerol lipase